MFKKIIMTMLVISIMVIGTTSLAVANTETENYSYSMKASRDEISEPFSSRWYRQDVVIYENKQGKFYERNQDKKGLQDRKEKLNAKQRQYIS